MGVVFLRAVACAAVQDARVCIGSSFALAIQRLSATFMASPLQILVSELVRLGLTVTSLVLIVILFALPMTQLVNSSWGVLGAEAWNPVPLALEFLWLVHEGHADSPATPMLGAYFMVGLGCSALIVALIQAWQTAQDTLHACIIRDLAELEGVHIRRKVAYYRAVSKRWREIQTEELREEERKANAEVCVGVGGFGSGNNLVDLGDRYSVACSEGLSSAASTDSGFDADALAALLAEDLEGVDGARASRGGNNSELNAAGDGSLMPGLVVAAASATPPSPPQRASTLVPPTSKDPLQWREGRHGTRDLVLRQLRAADAVDALRNVLARWTEPYQLMALKKRRVIVEVEEEEEEDDLLSRRSSPG